MLINCLFLENLPLEMFYFDSFNSFLGGTSVYYLGVYGIGTLISKNEARASTLARYDGFETIGCISGTLLSPIVLNNLSATASYSFRIGADFIALLYLLIFIKEPANTKSRNTKVYRSKIQLLFKPLKDMFGALFRLRPNGIHILLGIQYFCFASYWFTIPENELKYLYLQNTLGFNGTDFSWLTVFRTSLNTVGLLLILPLLSCWCKLHDTMIQTIVITCECIGYFLFAFSNKVWQVYSAIGIGDLMGFCKYGLVCDPNLTNLI